MKFSIRLPGGLQYKGIASPWEANLPPAESLRFARRVDGLAFDSIWVAEHIVQHPKLVPSLGAKFYEALSAAAVLLGATHRVKLLTYVTPLPYHNPVVYAKSIATVDQLCGGRLLLGLAVGHLKREFAALGADFAGRGEVCDEYLRAMKELWRSDAPEFQGQHVAFSGIAFEPKPLQVPHPPILIGGDARPVLRRAARLGDGWLPWQTPHHKLPEAIAYIYDQPAMQDRRTPFEIFALLVDMPVDNVFDFTRFHIPRERAEILEMAHGLEEMGCTGLVVHPPLTESFEESLAWTEWFSDEVIGAYRK